MAHYCVNRNAQDVTGDHEVHNLDSHKGCLPEPINQVDLGYHASCRSAVIEATRRGHSPADGCRWCSPECHTR